MIDIDTERLWRSPFLIGLLGSLVALKGSPGDTWGARAFNLVCGSLMAGFCSPAVASFLGLSDPSMQSASAFAVGLFGLNVVATATGWLKHLTLADVLPWVKRGG